MVNTLPERATNRIACVLRPQIAPEQLAAAARTADTVGVAELWLWEDCFLHGGLSAAAIALSSTQRITVGIGVLPVPLRNVAATAMEIATLARAFPGRLRVGVGHGVQEWMNQVGAKVDSPMTLLREYLTCLRALLDGHTVSFAGRYLNLQNVTLDWPPATRLELLCAAGGPKTLQLSGELADGTILSSGTSPESVARSIELIDRGRPQSGARSRPSLLTSLICVTGTDAAATLAREKQHWGYPLEADVGVFGDASRIAHGVQRWLSAGATTIALQPRAQCDIHDFLTTIGTEVVPRLG